MRCHPLRLLVLAVACVITATIPAAAQQTTCGPNDVVTTWWPRFSPNAGSETLTAAERKTVLDRLSGLEAMMRQTNYASPRGFAVTPVFRYHEITSRTELYQYWFDLQTAKLCSKYDEHGPDLRIRINPDPMAWSQSDRPMPDERGDGLYSEIVRTETLFGSTVTFGRFHAVNDQFLKVLFTTGDQSPTLPVSREEYLRAIIFTLEGKDQEKVKAALAIASKTPLERWMEDAPARKKRNEELFALLAKVAPDQLAKTRADTEKAEQAELEKLQRADAYERAQVSKNVASLTAAGDRYRAQLAAMTPQERASQAFVLGDTLVPAGTPNSWRIARKNPAFYRTTGSPFAPKAILVEMANTHREYWDQQEQLYKQLDWAAIKKMVNP